MAKVGEKRENNWEMEKGTESRNSLLR